MRETNSGIFYKMLQVEEGTEIGWFLYSSREMDAGALADEPQETQMNILTEYVLDLLKGKMMPLM